MTENEIVESLKNGDILEFQFTKQDGSHRRLLGKWLVKDSIEEEINAPQDRYILWDVESNGWRSVNKNSIESVRAVLFEEN